MHFCSNCDNMYYIKISEENENDLLYYCRNCGNKDDTLTKDNICSENEEEFKYLNISHSMYEYLSRKLGLDLVSFHKLRNSLQDTSSYSKCDIF